MLEHRPKHAAVKQVSFEEKIKVFPSNDHPILQVDGTVGNSPTTLYTFLRNGAFYADNLKIGSLKRLLGNGPIPDTMISIVAKVMDSINIEDEATATSYEPILWGLLINNPNLGQKVTVAYSKNYKDADLACLQKLEKLIVEPNNQSFHLFFDKKFVAPKSLKSLRIAVEVMKPLDLSQANQLEILDLGEHVNLVSYTAPDSLRNLTLRGLVQQLDLSSASHLETLYLAYTDLVSYTAPASLRELSIRGSLKQLDLSHASHLERLTLTTKEHLASCIAPPSLKKLHVDCSLQRFSALRANQLETLYLGHNSSVAYYAAPASLKELVIFGSVKHLDLSQMTRLDGMYFSHGKINVCTLRRDQEAIIRPMLPPETEIVVLNPPAVSAAAAGQEGLLMPPATVVVGAVAD